MPTLYRERFGTDTWHPPRARRKFNGQCFRCGAFKHMQCDCPLSQCDTCFDYGHEDSRCTKMPIKKD